MQYSENSSTGVTPPVTDLLSVIIMLCQGENEHGQPFWAYLCISPTMAKAFDDARKSGQFNLAEYGTIIESGEGETVPDTIKTRMQNDYGVRDDYEQQLSHAIDRIQKNYLAS